MIVPSSDRSRNARLSPEARSQSPDIYKALCWAQEAVKSGSETDPARLREHIAKVIEEAGGKVDYIEFADARNLSAVTDASKQSTLLAVAALFGAKEGKGTVRLIDNVVLGDEVLD